jgi:hypothetical protein
MSPVMRGFAPVLLGFVGVFALPGCGTDTAAFPTSSSSGSGGGGGQGSGTSSSAASTGSGEVCPGVGDSCTTCESASCPKAYCDCYQDPECVLMATCLAKCAIGDEPCDQLCWTAHPSAISEGALLLDCAGTTCSKGCPGYKPIGACLVCVYTSCQMEMNTCIANPDCTQLLACVSACTAPGCETSCYQMWPKGSAGAGPVANCLQAHCAAECAP